jgi:poly(A) polymerase/tRNA nucleotidyltransferase (CCA-adding enzyme)
MVPVFVTNIIKQLNDSNYDAWIVGGCVRDLLMNREPTDWDITTNARPEDILKVFPEAVYENVFGTVLVKIKNGAGETEEVVEVTTYRSEQGYADRRHPDEIHFEDSLDKDLARRDFTINALAVAPLGARKFVKNNYNKLIELDNEAYELVDYFGGEKDIKQKIIRAVGEPSERFREDALRLLRAVRFYCQLGFKLEPKTERAIVKLAGGLKFIANERIRDELVKILQSGQPAEGIRKLEEDKLLQYIIPELLEGIGMEQKGHHIYTVFDHSVLALKHCPSPDWRVRLAALLHDVAKPKTRKVINGENTFYNHDFIGAKMTKKIVERLKLSSADAEKIVTLVANHMFYYNVDEVTAASVRRLIVKVGEQNLKDLIDLRVADRLGSGTPKAMPYKLRHFQYMLDKVRHDPISVKMLKINGSDLMAELKLEPGPKIGAILDVLLSEVIEDPKLNTKEHLSQASQELNKLDLKELREKAKLVIAEKRTEEDKQIKISHHVA